MMVIDQFCQAWRQGKVCLHPTDTIPGLSFHPELASACEALYQVKSRPVDKACISLAANFAIAAQYWQPLPKPWPEILAELWPGPITVIWQAKDPKGPLVHQDGSLGIRVPDLCEHSAWFQQVLVELACLVPTTSVNSSGQAAARSWEEAKAFAADRGIYIPEQPTVKEGSQQQPSTIIKIDRQSFSLLRSGPISYDTIAQELQNREGH